VPLAAQRAQEQRENAAGLAAASLQKHVTEVEERLTSLASVSADRITTELTEYSRGLPADSVLLVLSSTELQAYPARHLSYYPVLPAAAEAPAVVFAAAERMEFQQNDYAAAIAVLNEQTHSTDPVIRAEALVRLARNLRKMGRSREASKVYGEIIQLPSVRVRGIPSDLLARGALCDVLEQEGIRERLYSEAAALHADLHNGRWRLLRPVYDVYTAQTRRVLGGEIAPLPPETAAVSEAVQTLWQQWRMQESVSGRQTIWSVDRSILVITRRSTERTLALFMGAGQLASAWTSELQALESTHNSRIALTDAQEHPVIGRVEQMCPP
jgi:hypothetical protein